MSSAIDPEDLVRRLGRIRAAIDGRFQSSAEGRRTSRLLARLESRLDRVLRVAVVGEPNSGKTTVANQILGSDLLAADVIQNTRTAVVVRHGDDPSVEVRLPNGRREILEPGGRHRLALGPGMYLEVTVPLPRLQRMIVVDTPGITGPDAPQPPWPPSWRPDLLVWCSIATQAWRATEVAAWRRLGWPRERSLLALTRADLLSETDRSKVMDRLSSEAGPLFRAILMVDGRAITPASPIAASAGEALSACRHARARHALAIVGRAAERLTPAGREEAGLALAGSEA